ncbi:MAG: CBO0543 family protein [Syntrophomonadaceae bacterium]|jgi:hypothetical protein
MSIEVLILTTVWILTIIMLILLVPKNRIREAIVVFFFKQFITWIIGLTVAEYKLISYPVRLFSYANKASFTFEYFVYPAICVVFILHYPEGRSNLRKFLYYFNFSTVMTIIEILCERYTRIIEYIHWEWYITWVTLFVTFYISRKFYVWFFSKVKVE